MTRSSLLIPSLALLSLAAGCDNPRSLPSRESPEITASDAAPLLGYFPSPDARRDGVWLAGEDSSGVVRRLDGAEVTDLFTVSQPTGYLPPLASHADDDVVVGLDSGALLHHHDGATDDLQERLVAALGVAEAPEWLSIRKVDLGPEGAVAVMVELTVAGGGPMLHVCRLAGEGDTCDSGMAIVAGSAVEYKEGAGGVVEGAGATWALIGESLHLREGEGGWASVTDNPVVKVAPLDGDRVAWAEVTGESYTDTVIHVVGPDGVEERVIDGLDATLVSEPFLGHAPGGLWRISADGEREIRSCFAAECPDPYLWVQFVIYHLDESGEREVGHINFSYSDEYPVYQLPELDVLPLADGGLRIEDDEVAFVVEAP